MEMERRIDLSKGRYIDFRSASMWKVAKVMKVESGKLLVQFVSHGTRKEEQRVREDSPLIAEFRTRTLGYTGEAKTTIKVYKFPKNEIELAMRYMDELMDKPISSWDQEEFVQRVRGDLFFLLDFLLTTLHLGKITEDLLKIVLSLHSKFFQFFRHWLQNDALICEELKKKIMKRDRSPATSFSDDLVELLNLYFSLNKRVYPTFEAIYKMSNKLSEKESETKLSGVIWTAEYFFFQFFNNGCSRELNRTLIDERGFPLALVCSFVSTLNCLAEQTKNQQVLEIIMSISVSLLHRLTTLGEVDMKELEHVPLSRLLSTIQPFLGKASELLEKNVQEEIEVTYIFKALKSQSVLRKRLGIDVLCQKCQLDEIVRNNQDQIKPEYKEKAQRAAEILRQMEIMKFLLSDHIDPELIAASKDIFRVMLLTENFSHSEIFILLSCFLNSEGRLRIVLMDSISSIAEYAPYPVLEEIFKELQRIPPEDYEEVFLHFIENYTVNALRNVKNKKKQAEELLPKYRKNKAEYVDKIMLLEKIIAQKEVLYDIDIFWNIFSSTSPRITSKFQQSAMDSLIKVAGLDEEIGNYYIIKAITLIRAGALETIRYMRFFMRAYEALNPDSEKRTTILSSASRIQKILPTVVDNLIIYKEGVNEEVKEHPENNSIMSTAFSPGYRHEEFIRGHFEFIAYLSESTKQKISLGKEEIRKLWNAFVLEANCIEETNCFFTQFLKAKEKAGKLCLLLLTEEQVHNLFTNYFMTEKFPIRSLNNIQYNSLKTLLVSINISKGILRYEGNRLVTVKEIIYGINKLWDIAFDCVDKEINEQSSTFIISLYSQVSKDMLPRLGEMSKLFSSIALEKASKSLSSETGCTTGGVSDRVLQAVQMVSTFIQEIEGPRYTKIDKSLYFAPPLIIFHCEVEFPGGKISDVPIKINQNLTILHLKKMISYLLKTPSTQITLRKLKKNLILDESYDQDYIVHNLGTLRVKVSDSGIPKAQLPSYAIANHEFCQKTLIQFMKLDEKYSSEIWTLMRRFPENSALINRLIKLDFKVEDVKASWLLFLGLERESLPKNSINSLLYNIYSIQRLLLNKMLMIKRPENYPQLFAEKMGFHFLLLCLSEAISGNNPEQVSGVTRLCRYLFKSLKCLILTNVESKALKVPEDNTQIEQVLHYMNSLIYSDKIKILLMSKKIVGIASKTIGNAVSFLNCLSFYSGEKSIQYILKESPIFVKILIDGVIRGEVPELCGGILSTLVNDIDSYTVDAAPYYCTLISLLLQQIIDPSIIQGKIQQEFFEFLYKLIENCRDDLIDFSLLFKIQFADQIVKLLVEKQKESEIFPYSIFYIRMLFVLLKRFKQTLLSDPRSESQIVDLCLRLAIPESLEKGVGRLELCYYFDLLAILCFTSEEYMTKISNKMLPTLFSAEWRTDSKLDWEIEVFESLSQSAASQLIGLDNPSNICYMNSVLQQLHMVPGFRKGVLEVNCGQSSSKEVLNSLKDICENLRNPARNSYNAAHLCRSVKDFEGQPLSIHEQRDADEFLNLLLDRLGDELKGTNRPSLIQDVFGGEFVNEIISLECTHRSVRKEEYLAINLQIQNKKSLDECLNAFIEAEELTGSNAYNCAYCNKKVNARKRVTLGVMPNTLIIVLKRFEFDFQKGIKKKLNDYLEFPAEINMEKFANFSIMKKEIMDKSKLAQDSNENKINDEERNILGLTFPGWYFQYKLKGVVLHEGTANSGHYTSLALSRDTNQWMEFNDSRTKPFHFDLLGTTAFGGQPDKKGGRQRNAYILVYEREDFLQMHGIRQLHEELVAASQESLDTTFEQMRVSHKTLFTVELSQEMEQLVNKDKAKMQRVQKYLNSSSVSFMIEAMTTTTVSTLSTWKFFVTYTLIGLLHVTARNQYPKILDVICSHNDIALSKWILQVFSNPHIMIEFFISCPCKESRLFAYSLFLNVFRVIYKIEEIDIFKFATNTELIQQHFFDLLPKKYLSSSKLGVFPLVCISTKIPICLLLLHNLVALLPIAFRTRTCISYCYLFDSMSRIHLQLLKIMLVYNLPGMIIEFLLNSVGDFTNKITPLLFLQNTIDIGLQFEVTHSSRLIVVSHGNPIKQARSLLSVLSRLLQQCGEPEMKRSSVYLTFIERIFPHKLSDKEMFLLNKLKTKSGMDKCFLLGNENAGKGGIDRLYSHLCFNSLDFSINCIRYCLDELSCSNYLRLPIYLMTLEQILLLSDDFQKDRISFFLGSLQEKYAEAFQDSFITFSYIVDLCIDLTLRNESFHRKMREKPATIIPLMGKWVSKYEIPKHICKPKESSKKETPKPEFSPEDIALMKEYSRERLNTLRQLEKIPSTHRTLPEFTKLSCPVQRFCSVLDMDLSNSVIQNREFDIYVNKKWTKGWVISSSIDIIQFYYLKSGYKREIWLKPLSGKIYPIQWRVDCLGAKYYSTLMKYIQAYQSTFIKN